MEERGDDEGETEEMKGLQGAIKESLSKFACAHQVAAETCLEELSHMHGVLSDDESTDRAQIRIADL